MKFVQPYKNTQGKRNPPSGSFLQSLASSSLVGIVATLLALGGGGLMYQHQVSLYVNVGIILALRMLFVIALMTIMLEQTRKRAIRATLELAFLNHHIHNALVQIAMCSNITDHATHDRYMQAAISRIAEALFRSGNRSNLATLALDVDLDGKGLNRTREERENRWAKGA
jgi:hypothetical protein